MSEATLRFDAWQRADIAPYLQEELINIANSPTEINERFYQYVSFGTGGMRGLLGAGTNRINMYTIRRVAEGLARYIVEQGEVVKQSGVVIAYDTRHFSIEFARETARVLGAYQIKSYIFAEPRPTPELSFAVRHLKAFAGVVITASHNPKAYNGFKVYGADGGQLTPTGANAIIRHMEEIGDIFSIEAAPLESLVEAGICQYILDELDEAYQLQLKQLKQRTNIEKDINIVYTPLHGAGIQPVTAGLKAFGFNNVYIVKEQAIQDGAFPTVPYPNPEEAVAFALAIQLGQQVGADLLLATDPDADRLGVAVRGATGYELLTGNQLGALLLHYLLSAKKENGTLPTNGVLLKTIVTSELGAVIARAYDVKTVDTLTGFKYIAEKIGEYEQSGEYTYVFGYEESYGYLIESFVRDKDAVQVALVTAEMAAYYAKAGKTLLDALQDIYKQFGYYKEALVSKVFEGMDGQQQMKAILDSYRKNVPTHIADVAVVRVEDYLTSEITFEDGSRQAIYLPKENVLKFVLADDSWVAIRPSGTEPKCKYYFGAAAESQDVAKQRLEQIQRAILT